MALNNRDPNQNLPLNEDLYDLQRRNIKTNNGKEFIENNKGWSWIDHINIKRLFRQPNNRQIEEAEIILMGENALDFIEYYIKNDESRFMFKIDDDIYDGIKWIENGTTHFTLWWRNPVIEDANILPF